MAAERGRPEAVPDPDVPARYRVWYVHRAAPPHYDAEVKPGVEAFSSMEAAEKEANATLADSVRMQGGTTRLLTLFVEAPNGVRSVVLLRWNTGRPKYAWIRKLLLDPAEYARADEIARELEARA